MICIVIYKRKKPKVPFHLDLVNYIAEFSYFLTQMQFYNVKVHTTLNSLKFLVFTLSTSKVSKVFPFNVAYIYWEYNCIIKVD